jgi:hypothetical protein
VVLCWVIAIAALVAAIRTRLLPSNGLFGNRPTAESIGALDLTHGQASKEGGREIGISAGNYSLLDGVTCTHCGRRIRQQCGFHLVGNSIPPELLVPGRLGKRTDLSEVALCFLWYAKTFWMRGTGGGTGLVHYRWGGIDNKALFSRHLARYASRNHCPPFQMSPVTVNLSDAAVCQTFYRNNSFFHPFLPTERTDPDERLWFIKDEMGSLGRHITLVSGRQIAAAAAQDEAAKKGRAAGTLGGEGAAGEGAAADSLGPLAICPQKGRVASLNVPIPWNLEGRKFDMRVYVLVASIHPLLVFFRQGHLRVSALLYQRDAASTVQAMHVTNPGFGLAISNDSGAIIRQVDVLRQTLRRRLGSRAGDAAWRRAELSVRKCVLQTVYAVREVWLDRELIRDLSDWGHAFIAADVMIDRSMNAVVLDVNTMPSFYHFEDDDTHTHTLTAKEVRRSKRQWPAWFIKERSATIRTALDIIEETAWRKIRDRRSFKSHKAGEQDAGDRGGVNGSFIDVLHSATIDPHPQHWPLLKKGIRTAEESGWDLLYNEVTAGKAREDYNELTAGRDRENASRAQFAPRRPGLGEWEGIHLPGDCVLRNEEIILTEL